MPASSLLAVIFTVDCASLTHIGTSRTKLVPTILSFSLHSTSFLIIDPCKTCAQSTANTKTDFKSKLPNLE